MAALADSERHDICSLCYTQQKTFLCGSCKYLRYCSKDCQKKDWKIHRRECGSHELANMSLKTRQTVMLLYRVLRAVEADNSLFMLLKGLIGHESDMSSDRISQLGSIATSMLAFMNERDIRMFDDLDAGEGKELVISLLARLESNSFAMWDSQLFPTGAGLFLFGSLLNHSCTPNALLSFRGRQVIIRCLEPITEGEEICHSYTDPAMPTPERRLYLRNQYLFDCDCPRCKQLLPSFVHDQPLENGQDVQQCVETVERHRRGDSENDNPSVVMAELQRCVTLQGKVLHRLHTDLLRTTQTLLDLCLEIQDWTQASLYCASIIDTYQAVYSSRHPLIGIYYFTLAKCQWNGNRSNDALETLRMSLEILRLTHGADEPLVLEVVSLMKQAESECAK
eukprot:GILJ01014607.1.p1 GENE.GILJ01014607.1~~GILJ01014607.1.p1  ORF type:complete len:436 (+),score=24.62 GILJ01014607.1:125-1309(+)